MTSVRRALMLSLLERYLLIVLSLVSNVVLARLLTPEQIGVYSVSLAVIGVVQVLRDFGVGNFLIQEKNLTESHVRSAFGISLLMGLVLFPLVFFGADWAARFYEEPRMRTTLRIVSLNFLVLPFCSISLALLRREMQFKRLLWVSLAAAVIGSVVSVGLAWIGMGADAMAVGAVSANVATGLGTWLSRGRRRFLLPSLIAWRPILRFGAQSSTVSVISSIAMDASDLFLGKLLGFSAVAMISRAQGLTSMIQRDLMGAVRNVAFPAFAQQARESRELEPSHVMALAHTSALLWPCYGFMALFAPEIVRLMFGAQWSAAAPLVAVMCLFSALTLPTYYVSTLLTAAGRIDLIAVAEPALQVLRAILIVGSVFIFRTMNAVPWALVAFAVVYLPAIYALKQRCVPTDFGTMLNVLGRSAIATLVALALPFMLIINAGWQRATLFPATIVLGAAFATIFLWVAAMLMLRHPLIREPIMVALISRILRLRRAASPSAP